MATVSTPMTTEELLALPDDGTDRWLIDGELRERPMPTRNQFHSYTMTRIARFLDTWRDDQPEPRGRILTGDAGVRLRRNPDTTFGVDIAYISPEVMAEQSEDSTLIDGVPVLTVLIPSPRSPFRDIDEKIDAYLDAGVSLVWIADPRRRTITVHRSDVEPELVNVQQELSGEPFLPGFRVAVRRLFE